MPSIACRRSEALGALFGVPLHGGLRTATPPSLLGVAGVCAHRQRGLGSCEGLRDISGGTIVHHSHLGAAVRFTTTIENDDSS